MMLSKIIPGNPCVVVTLSVAFFTNIINALNDMDISLWLGIGTFILALIVSIVRIRVNLLDIKKKKLEITKLKLEDGEQDAEE